MTDDLGKESKKVLDDMEDVSRALSKQLKDLLNSTDRSVKNFGFMVDQSRELSEQTEKTVKLSQTYAGLGDRIERNAELIAKYRSMPGMAESFAGANDLVVSLQEQNSELEKQRDTINKINLIENSRLKPLQLQQGLYSTFLKPVIGDSKEYNKIIDLGSKLMKGGMTAYLAIIDAAIERWMALDKAAAAFRRSTGLILPQMEQIAKSVREINVDMANLGVTLEKAYESAAALVEAFQTTALVSKEMIADSAQLAANLGLSVTDIAEFNSKFSESTKSAGTTVQNVERATVALANMAGVAPTKAMNDIAKASSTTLTFLAKAPMAMMRTAIEARRMGTTLDSVANSARGMLNYQDSMTSELEASALLNKNISFQQSRQLAWEGKIVEAREAALKQIERAGDFTKMNVYQQESLAKAAGLTVEEITKQQNQQKALAAARRAATGDEKKSFDEYDEYIKKLRGGNKETEADLARKGNELKKQMLMQAKMEQITNALTAAWTDLTDAMLPIAEVIMPVIIFGAKALGVIFKGIGYAIKNWGLIFLVAKALQPIAEWSVKIYEGFSRMAKNLRLAVSLGLEFEKPLSTAWKIGIKFVSVIESIGTWIGSIGSKLGTLSKGIGIVGKIGMLFGKWIPIIGWIITASQVIIDLFGQWSDIWSSDMDIGDKIIKSLYAIPNALFNTIISPIIDIGVWIARKFGADIPDSMVDGIKSVGKEILQWLIFPFNKATDWLFGPGGWLANSPSGIGLGIVDGLKAVGGMIFDFLCSPFTRAWDMIKKLPLVGKIFGAVGDAAKAVGGEISAKVEAATSTVVEIKNLDVLNEAIDKLTAAVSALGGTAGGAATIIPGNDNSSVVSKLDELISLMKSGGISVNMDSRKVSSVIASPGR